MNEAQYPIGQYQFKPYSDSVKSDWLADILFLPQEVENALLNLDEAQLHTPYRRGGWTLHQVVHHLADSHINAYTRFKLALTEDQPSIKPYDENKWNELSDIDIVPINTSITLLHALHARWHATLKNLSEQEWERTLYHPGSKKIMTLWNLLGMYAWHGKHHTAHILYLRNKNNW